MLDMHVCSHAFVCLPVTASDIWHDWLHVRSLDFTLKGVERGDCRTSPRSCLHWSISCQRWMEIRKLNTWTQSQERQAVSLWGKCEVRLEPVNDSIKEQKIYSMDGQMSASSFQQAILVTRWGLMNRGQMFATVEPL